MAAEAAIKADGSRELVPFGISAARSERGYFSEFFWEDKADLCAGVYEPPSRSLRYRTGTPVGVDLTFIELDEERAEVMADGSLVPPLHARRGCSHAAPVVVTVGGEHFVIDGSIGFTNPADISISAADLVGLEQLKKLCQREIEGSLDAALRFETHVHRGVRAALEADEKAALAEAEPPLELAPLVYPGEAAWQAYVNMVRDVCLTALEALDAALWPVGFGDPEPCEAEPEDEGDRLMKLIREAAAG